MSTNAVQEQWLATAVGRGVSFVEKNGYQCPDPDKDYAQAIFGVPWVHTIGYGDAKDLFVNSSDVYFDKIPNDPNDFNQMPERGDIIFWAAWPANTAGHTMVVTSADASGVHGIEEDGSFPTLPMHLAYFPYTWHTIIGWIRPKLTQGDVMDREDAINSYQSAHLHYPSEEEIQGRIGKKYSDVATAERTSDEWKAVDEAVTLYPGMVAAKRSLINEVAGLNAVKQVTSQPISLEAPVTLPVNTPVPTTPSFFDKDTATGKGFRTAYQSLAGVTPFLVVLWSIPQVQAALGGTIPLSAAVVPAIAGLVSYLQNK